MPRPRPPHLQREITRHGKAVWYVRVAHGPRIRLKAKYGSPEFDAEYRAALAGASPIRKASPVTSSLAWLIARYRETTAWSDLSVATRKRRDNIFAGMTATAGVWAQASDETCLFVMPSDGDFSSISRAIEITSPSAAAAVSA